MNLKEHIEDNFNLVIQNTSLTFPELLLAIRQGYGVSRRKVSKHLNIPYLRIFMLENGYFVKALKEQELESICNYYSIDPLFFNAKMSAYLASGEGIKLRREYESRHPSKSKPKKRKKK